MIKVHRIDGINNPSAGSSSNNMTELNAFLEKIQKEGATVTKVKFENFVVSKTGGKVKTKSADGSKVEKTTQITGIQEIAYVTYNDNK